tara:strand:+ start:65 stop:253 length:189 start_codon:yes stop_codon:yes gene_type:complete
MTKEEKIAAANARIKELEFFLHQADQVTQPVHTANWLDHLDRKNYAKKRIKELELLLHHWAK